MFLVFKSLLKEGGDVRKAVMAWLVDAADVLREFAKDTVDEQLMLAQPVVKNLSSIMLLLSNPFVVGKLQDSRYGGLPTWTKLGKIAPDYIKSYEAQVVYGSDCTTLGGQTIDNKNASPERKEFNFMTRCFFITAWCCTLASWPKFVQS